MTRILLFAAITIGFLLCYVIIDVKNVARQETFYQTHEVFCKECCWKHEDIYTCTKKKEQLWKRIH